MVISKASEAAVDRLFHALSDATRRDILRRSSGGDLSLTRLAEDYPISFVAVRKHVAVLEDAGLITTVRLGRERRVRVDPAALDRARRALEQIEQIWRHRVDSMAALLDAPSPTTPTEGRTP